MYEHLDMVIDQKAYKEFVDKLNYREIEYTSFEMGNQLVLEFDRNNYHYVKPFEMSLSSEGIKNILLKGNFPDLFVDNIFNGKTNFTRSNMNYAKDILEDVPLCFLLGGESGYGKTYCAIYIAWQLVKRRVIESPAFMMPIDIKRIFTKGEIDRFNYHDADLIVLDDLGTEDTTSEKASTNIYNFLENRIKYKKITIITTNYSDMYEVERVYGERFVNRVREYGTFQFDSDLLIS